MTSGPSSVASASAAEPPTSQTTRGRLGFAFQFIEPLVFAGDFFVVFISSIFCGVSYHLLTSDTLGDIEDFIAIAILVWVNFATLTSAQRNYSVENLINRGRQLRYLTLDWTLICLVIVGVAFTLKISDHFSRGATLLFFVVGWGGLVGYRFAIARYLSLALERGAFSQKKIIVIAERGQLNSTKELDNLRKCGYLPFKFFEITQAEMESTSAKTLQAKVNQIVSICHSEPIEHLVLVIKWSRRQFIDDLVRRLRVLAIPVNLLPDEDSSRFLAARTSTVGTAWTVELQRAPLTKVEQAIKRAFDIFIASIAIFILAPILLLVGLLVKLDSTGPALFKQRRHGFNGRAFVIYKFRTMLVLEDGLTVPQAKRNDPRVTRLGRWLRQTSIDELPQLFNVFTGQMSLVGPRPHAVAHNDEYQKILANYAFRHHVKPGITGWAQVNGHRGETETIDKMERRVEHDLWYINHWSLWLDLRIMLKTMMLVYRQPTAY